MFVNIASQFQILGSIKVIITFQKKKKPKNYEKDRRMFIKKIYKKQSNYQAYRNVLAYFSMRDINSYQNLHNVIF